MERISSSRDWLFVLDTKATSKIYAWCRVIEIKNTRTGWWKVDNTTRRVVNIGQNKSCNLPPSTAVDRTDSEVERSRLDTGRRRVQFRNDRSILTTRIVRWILIILIGCREIGELDGEVSILRADFLLCGVLTSPSCLPLYCIRLCYNHDLLIPT